MVLYVDPHKINQDEYSIVETLDADSSLFAIYDGHGPYGDERAKFAKVELPKLFKDTFVKDGLRNSNYVRRQRRTSITLFFDPLGLPLFFLIIEDITIKVN